MTAPAHDITVRDAVSEIEDLYSEHFELLLGIAIRTFDIPREDAATLVHDVFVSLISRLAEIRHRRAWLDARAGPCLPEQRAQSSECRVS
ncbi:MAG: hypothetical protein ACYC7A_04815 [Thermoanaerobaculia bacterium]